MAEKKGLGRGLGALISDEAPISKQPANKPAKSVKRPSGGIKKVALAEIARNKRQPRQVFDEAALADLASSIKEHGVLQPLLVRAAGSGSGFELIAGERRLRAATAVGLSKVPVIVVSASDGDSLELALIENLQRENLNVIEEADGYRELATEFNLTQEEIAARVGKSRAAVANAMRLLSLPEEVRAMLADNRLSSGHAKVLLGLNREKDQLLMSRKVVEEGLSVRELERAVKRRKAAPKKPRVAKSDIPSNHVTYLSDQLHAHFGTSIRVNPCKTYANGKKGKGTIEIDFFSNEDLERILEIIGLSSDE